MVHSLTEENGNHVGKTSMTIHVSLLSLHNSPRHFIPKDATKTLYSIEEKLWFREATSLSHTNRGYWNRGGLTS